MSLTLPHLRAISPRFPLWLGFFLLLGGCAAEKHHLSGMNAVSNGDFAKGIPELEQAATIAPQNVEFRNDWLRSRELAVQRLLSQGESALAGGDSKSAEEYYRIILTFESGNARALAGLEKLRRIKRAAEDAAQARVAYARGDEAVAAELSARALESDPGQAGALALRRELDAAQAKQFVSAPSMDGLYKKPVNLEFRDASVKMIFDALTRTTGINFIFDRDAKSDQRTTVFLRQTSLEDAIDVILTTTQLEKKILNPTSVLIYTAGSAKSREYQDLVVRAFYLSSAEAKNTANMLKTVLKVKDVFVDEKMNMLVLRETPETISLAEKLISLHDLDQPEVMLEVEVLEVTRSRLLDLGIKLTDTFTISPLNTTDFKLSDLTSLGKSQLGITAPSATLSANAQNVDSNLLANPRIRVRDREKAKFMIGDKLPVVTTTNTSNGFSTENITYQDVGLKLEVEPEVHLRDEIGLKLALEVSSLVSSVKTNNGSLAYQIGSRSVSSVLRLKDGETQVLAGLINDEDRSTANGLPFLSDLPVLGRLFSSKNDSHVKTEIVLSITPHLIRNLQRKEPAAESFWSGTEASLRTKPLQLRTVTAPTISSPAAGERARAAAPAPMAGAALSVDPRAVAPVQLVPVPGAAQLRWVGPDRIKLGSPFTLELRINSADALRAIPLQLGYDPAVFDVLSVKAGDYFSKQGPANFSHQIDKASGRVSIGSALSDGAEKTGAAGEGGLLSIELMPLRTSAETQINVITVAPIGQLKPVPAPALPYAHTLVVTQ
jgi:general secretion pathway protein D